VQLIALIPIVHGIYLTIHTAKISGIETHHETEEFRHWSRSVVHAVIRDVMAPIERVMRNGVQMTCADGAERLCFPLLCEYIGDMPEQWLLTCLVQPACTKCLYRGTPDANDPRYTRRNAVNKINQDLADNHPRTDTHPSNTGLNIEMTRAFHCVHWVITPRIPSQRITHLARGLLMQ
jgi:hypothetical protein